MTWIIRIVLAVVLLAMVWMFYQQHHTTTKSSIKHAQAQEYMKKISITDYAENGTPKQKIHAYSWAFVPNEKQSKVVVPEITIYKPNGDVWNIAAKKAYAKHRTIQDKIEEIEMYDEVRVTKVANDQAQTTDKVMSELLTEELHYYPEEKKVTSKVLVTMRQPDLLITGVGMLGYLETSWVQLFDRTTTIYNNHTIKSTEVTFDNQQGTALYKKNVTVDNDTNASHLSADSLSIHRDSQNKIKTLVAHGKPATYIKGSDKISGPILNYDVATETLHTKNSKVIIQDPKAHKGNTNANVKPSNP